MQIKLRSLFLAALGTTVAPLVGHADVPVRLGAEVDLTPIRNASAEGESCDECYSGFLGLGVRGEVMLAPNISVGLHPRVALKVGVEGEPEDEGEIVRVGPYVTVATDLSPVIRGFGTFGIGYSRAVGNGDDVDGYGFEIAAGIEYALSPSLALMGGVALDVDKLSIDAGGLGSFDITTQFYSLRAGILARL